MPPEDPLEGPTETSNDEDLNIGSSDLQQNSAVFSGGGGDGPWDSSLQRDEDATTAGFDASNPSHARSSFLRFFFQTKGLPQILLVSFFITFSYGNILTLIPIVSTQRFATLHHRYPEDARNCHDFELGEEKPEACRLGSEEAQNAHALCELVANVFILVFGSVVGSISDTQGRRKWLTIGTALALTGNFAFLYVCVVPTASPWIFYTIRPIHGLVSWTIVALAAVADQMPTELRAPSVGLVMAAYWSGVCSGPTSAAVLGLPNAPIVSCLSALVAICTASCCVPETVTPERAQDSLLRQHQEGRLFMTLSPRVRRRDYFSVVWRTATKPLRELAILNRSSLFRLLSLLAFFNGMVTSGDKILILYYVDTKLSFSTVDTALVMILLGLGAVLSQGIILKPLNDAIGERWIVILCFGTAIVSNLLYGLAQNRSTIAWGLLWGSFSGMAFPTFSAIKANNAEASEQGRVQGALYSVLAVASGVGPLFMRLVDSFVVHHLHRPSGAMFVFAAMLQAIAFVSACYLPKDKTNSRPRHQATAEGTDVLGSG